MIYYTGNQKESNDARKISDVYGLLTRIRRGIRKIKTEEMAEFSLKTPHVSCLYYLYGLGAMTVQGLSDVCSENKSVVSRAVAKLEGDGLVRRASDSEKKYNALLFLTERGSFVAEKIAKRMDDTFSLAGAGLNADKRESLCEGLSLICENLEKICNQYGEENGGVK